MERRVDMDILVGITRDEITDDQAVTRLKIEIQDRLGELEKELAGADYETSSLQHSSDNYLNIGEVIITGKERLIIGGHLTPARSTPIVRFNSPAILQFITQLDVGDSLKGETHGFGVHYHYYNWKGVRTDAVLSWDTRWSEPNPNKKKKEKTPRPLFWEFHAERNAKGEARPGRWQTKKRQLVHAACTKDLKRWPISEFRCAGDDSLPVWPLGSILTPRPAAGIQTKRRRR